MIVLKLVKYTNTPGTFECEWINRDVVPAVGTQGEEGYQPEKTTDVVIRVSAYSGDQINLFRADVIEHGGDTTEWESLLADVESEWVAPAPAPAVIPQVVTMRQARLALLSAGLLENVNTAISSIVDNNERLAAQINWEYAQTVQRSDPWVQNISSVLNLTSQQLDDLFSQAATL